MYEHDYWHQQDPDGITRDIAKERDRKLEDLKDELAYINALPRGRILDYGCGLGFALSGIHRRHERWGFDISKYAIDEAKRLNPDVRFEDLNGIPDAYFDAIMCYHVLEHLNYDNGIALIGKLSGLLKPDGRLIIGTPNNASLVAVKWGLKYRMRHDKTHLRLWTDFELSQELARNNLFVERIEYPFFGTRYDNEENCRRALGPPNDDWSPPFAGNIMTIYARKRICQYAETGKTA